MIMLHRFPRAAFISGALAVLIALQALAEEDQSPPVQLRVMSFNVRFGTADDGENSWANRKELLVETIRQFAPHLLGTQEMLRFQADYLVQSLPDYHYVGQSRVPDKPDEECGIFVHKGRFHTLEQGHFWLSETPERPGSKSWDSSLPRMATWLKLYDQDAKQPLHILNTHFDHRGIKAREESARLIRNRLEGWGPDASIIVTGDFNAPDMSVPYTTLAASANSLTLVDCFRLVHPTQKDNLGTYHGFRGIRNGARIDWILCSPRFRVIRADIETACRDNRYASDHFPVVAVLEWSDGGAVPSSN
jgi:endonuclease/exonuclease/phosphatase family metal-dependent hydrolase